MSESTDTGALVALGKPVTLASGETRMVRFTNRSAATLEQRFGGIDKFVPALRTEMLANVAYVFALVFKTSQDDALDNLIDGRRMLEYIAAITDSLVEFYGVESSGPTCASCDKQLPADARFCPSCGVPVPEQSDQGEAESQGAPPGEGSSTSQWSPSESTRSASGIT